MERTNWYKEAVVYQIYPFSFKDSNNDGMGDIPGIISKLDYLKDLGVTAIWFSPLYVSPCKDYGYDVADYKAIDPKFGTMEDFDQLMEECRKRDIRVIMDMVLNHTSDQHEWFRAALADPESPYRDYYIIRKGRRVDSDAVSDESGTGKVTDGHNAGQISGRIAEKVSDSHAGKQIGRITGKLTNRKTEKLLPPTNWTSSFTGPAWQRIEGTDEFYLHLFAPEQPDLNWENPAVRDEIIDILKFWLDKGVSGFRFDVFNMYSKVYPLKDDRSKIRFQKGTPYYVDGPRMHEFLKEMNERALSLYDTYTVGESYIPDPEHAFRYISEESGELDSIFDFEHLDSDSKLKFIRLPFSLKKFKKGLFEPQLRYHGKGWNTLVLENHDNPRSVSRFGINTKKYRYEAATFLALITFMGWGTPFIYQGEEIGMTNADFRSIGEMKDPVTGFVYDMMTKAMHMPKKAAFGLIRGGARDHARTPMQWDDSVNAGFNEGARPWQCVNRNYTEINVKKDLASDKSIYRFYQKLLAFRKSDETALYGETIEYDPDNKYIVAYSRSYEGKRLLIAGNFSDKPREFIIPEDFALADLGIELSNYDDQVVSRVMQLRPYEAILFSETR